MRAWLAALALVALEVGRAVAAPPDGGSAAAASDGGAAASVPDGGVTAAAPDGGIAAPDGGASGAAACIPIDRARADEADNALGGLAPAGVKSVKRTVFGLALVDRPAALDALQRALAPKPTATWQNARRAACADVRCALAATLGSDEAARWFLVIALRTGAVPALDGYWRTGELRFLARAALELPDALTRLPTLKRFRRPPDGEAAPASANASANSSANSTASGAAPASSASGALTLDGTFWAQPPIARRAALFRELARQFAQNHGRPSRAPTAADFADAVADARVRPRLQTALRRARPDAAAQLEWGVVPIDPQFDQLAASLGGLLEPLAACVREARYVGHFDPAANLGHFNPPPSLLTTLSAGAFTGDDGCVEQLWDRLTNQRLFTFAACRGGDPETLRVSFEHRAAELLGAIAEALEAVRAEVSASARPACFDRDELTAACLAGDAARARAAAEARRLIAEFPSFPVPASPVPAAPVPASPGVATTSDLLARTLIDALPLWPTDAELFARFPALDSPARLVAACLLGVDELTFAAGDGWRFRAGERRLALPIDRTCREFPRALHHAAAVSPRVIDEPLVAHLQRVLRPRAERLLDRFHREILEGRGELERVCAAEGGVRAHPEAAPCTEAWLRLRLARLFPRDTVDALAARLAAALH